MRANSRQRGYDTRWEKASRTYRSKYPYCAGCKATGKDEPATLVDHIVPHRGDQRLFWDTDNWQSSCEWHHNAIKARLERMYDNKQITITDLRLDSQRSIALTRSTPRKTEIGLDGWPI